MIWLIAAVVVIAAAAGITWALTRSKNEIGTAAEPEVEAGEPTEEAEPPSATTVEAEAAEEPSEPEAPAIEKPEPTAGRLVRLRARLSRSNSVFGKGLLALLSSDKLDEEVWEEIEDTLLTADVGIQDATAIVENLRERVQVLGTRDPAELKRLLREELTAVLDPDMDRSINTTGAEGKPAPVLVVGVNGAGKTTTCGKIARVLVADGNKVVLGAADTFRAAAAEQLSSWGDRVGVPVVRRDEGADPASVAFEAVKEGDEQGADVVLVDTAGRLQNKAGLMDELGKVKRVIEKREPITETLLIIDATTGQNGLRQAEVFSQVTDVSGVVLTKLDGSAKGGIVIAVQRALGVPVKLVGLGEGPDDLAPFEVEGFVDALVDGTD
ncbi:signal recognition particle-docking protein FtsY [Salininema proteolyticum]|uniref:Signal recognition particle receptor FtsY n=1 Tax=Salininema proteolyticum TaxID=1607685 RepID=A0ABV8U1B6_9ACTN